MLSPVPFIQAQPNLQELQKQCQQLREENQRLKILQGLQEELRDLKQDNQALRELRTQGNTRTATSQLKPATADL